MDQLGEIIMQSCKCKRIGPQLRSALFLSCFREIQHTGDVYQNLKSSHFLSNAVISITVKTHKSALIDLLGWIFLVVDDINRLAWRESEV